MAYMNVFMFLFLGMICRESECSLKTTLQNCTDDNFIQGVVECFKYKFEDILPFTDYSFSHKPSNTDSHKVEFHEPKDNTIRYNYIMPSITQRMTDNHKKILDYLYELGKAVANKEIEVITIEKLKHVNFEDMIYEYVVEIMHQIAPVASQNALAFRFVKEAMFVDDVDLCSLFCKLPGSYGCQICEKLISAMSCLEEFTATDFEDNIKWIKCFFSCEDLIPISSCLTDHFSQCGKWSILSDVIIRGFTDFTELDNCLMNVITSKNITLIEGGDGTYVEFYNYLPPGAHCVDLKGLSEPLGMIRALRSLLGVLLGNTPECVVQIQMSLQNFWNDLLPDIDVFGIDGRPKCHDGSSLRQAVIANHDYASGTETCIINITLENWNITHKVPVWPSVDLKVDGDVNASFTLKLTVGKTIKSSEKIPIMIEDQDSAEVSLCQSSGDPHITTFDGHYYSNLYDGYFYLYRNKDLSYQVQVLYQRCITNGNASCTCAVAIKSGDDVFVIDTCRRRNNEEDKLMKAVIFVNGELTRGTRVFRKHHGAEFLVILPTGARVEIVASNEFLNVYLTPSTYDWKNTEGLCGTFDANVTNDLTMPNGSIYTDDGSDVRGQPRPFIKEWRVAEEDRIFEGALPEQLPEANSPFCKCNHVIFKGVQCTCGDGELIETCDINLEGDLGENITALMRVSKKAIADEGDIDMEDIDIDEKFEPPEINWEDNTAWNETHANQSCSIFISDNEFIQNCTNDTEKNFLQQAEWHCVDDIAITDTDNWKWSAMESGKRKCIAHYQRQSNQEYDKLGNALCINGCNEHDERGYCDNGSCICDSGWTGGDCSLKSGEITVMKSSRKCDKRYEGCTFATVYGKYFPDDESLTCSLQEAEIDKNTGQFIRKETIHEVGIMYISPNQVVCFLPTSGSYVITLQKDRNPVSAFANKDTGLIFMAYDSVCYSCDVIKETCEKKSGDGYCIIEESCYANTQVNQDETCQYCNSTQDTANWTWFTDDFCEQKKQEKVGEEEKEKRERIIRISVACALTTLIILLTVVLFIRSKRKEKGDGMEDLDKFNGNMKIHNQQKDHHNPAFNNSDENMHNYSPEAPMSAPRVQELKKSEVAPRTRSGSSESRGSFDFSSAKKAALEIRQQQERQTSISSTHSVRSVGLGAGGSLAFSHYHHLSDEEQGDGHSSGLDKGIGAHATPTMTKKSMHDGISVTTWF